jgi:nitrogen fixation protein NifU and related proteins
VSAAPASGSAEAASFGELRDLYQEVILDHGRRPRNHRRLEAPTHHARGDNPMCGDRVKLDLRVDGGAIAEAGFEARGCAVSVASASLMSEAVRGLPAEEARALARRFREMARTGVVAPGLKALAPLAGVHEFPSRVKCATLAWHALEAALDGAKEASSE